MMDPHSFQVGEVCLDCKELGEERKLKYFFVNCVDRIVKCESASCIYPYVFDDESDAFDTNQTKQNLANHSASYPNVKNETNTSMETDTAVALNILINEVSFDIKDLEIESIGGVSSQSCETSMQSKEDQGAKLQKNEINPKAEILSQNDEIKIHDTKVKEAENPCSTQTLCGAEPTCSTQPRRTSRTADLSKKDSLANKIHDTKVGGAVIPSSTLPRRTSKNNNLSKQNSSTNKIHDKKVGAAQTKYSTQPRRSLKTADLARNDSTEILLLADSSAASQPNQKTKVSNYFQKINALEFTEKKERSKPLKKPKIKLEKPSNDAKFRVNSSLSSLDEIRKLVQQN